MIRITTKILLVIEPSPLVVTNIIHFPKLIESPVTSSSSRQRTVDGSTKNLISFENLSRNEVVPRSQVAVLVEKLMELPEVVDETTLKKKMKYPDPNKVLAERILDEIY